MPNRTLIAAVGLLLLAGVVSIWLSPFGDRKRCEDRTYESFEQCLSQAVAGRNTRALVNCKQWFDASFARCKIPAEQRAKEDAAQRAAEVATLERNERELVIDQKLGREECIAAQVGRGFMRPTAMRRCADG